MIIELTIVTIATIGAYEYVQRICAKRTNGSLDFAVKQSGELAKVKLRHRHTRSA